MSAPSEFLAEAIASGLKRRTVTTCSRWAEKYRIMGKPYPGPWSFDHHPWCRAMHDCLAEMVVGQKAAQVGFTETALNKAFFHIDIKRESVLYILPASTPDAGDFSASRFDPALELSVHLSNLFSDVKNIGHKRAGNASLFIRGSRSRAQMKSLPVSLIIGDEVDEMNQENLVLAFERTSGQVEQQTFLLSTPTIEKVGINLYFAKSTQDHYFFKCPHCNKLIELTYPASIVITGKDFLDPNLKNSYYICTQCKGRLEHDQKQYFLKNGIWVPSYTDRDWKGFLINQMYSSTISPAKFADAAMRAELNPTNEQEFYNNKLGLPHTVEGAKISDADIEKCMTDYVMLASRPSSGVMTMGIDVGKWLHYEVVQYVFINDNYANDINLFTRARVIAAGKVLNFEELDKIMIDYGIQFCVIDANPERRKALEFANRFLGIVYLCFYGSSPAGRVVKIHNEEDRSITVDRTCWMDLALGRVKNAQISLPKDIPTEYKEHIKAPVRVYRKDQFDNDIGVYVKGNEDDHHAHARTYAEIALPFATGLAQCQNITGVM